MSDIYLEHWNDFWITFILVIKLLPVGAHAKAYIAQNQACYLVRAPLESSEKKSVLENTVIPILKAAITAAPDATHLWVCSKFLKL